MTSNLERFKKDLQALISKGDSLLMAMQYECYPDEVQAKLKERLKTKAPGYIKELPDFKLEYQRWYSEAHSMLR